MKHPRRLSRRGTLALLGAVAAFLCWSAVNYYTLDAKPDSGGDCSLHQDPHTDRLETSFVQWMASKFSPLPDPRLATVSISEDSEPLRVLNNTCQGRLFTQALVAALNTAGAKVIALDKFYSAGSCTDDSINRGFSSALSTSSARIVVGQATHPRPAAGKQDDCLVLTEPFPFNVGAASSAAPAPGNRVLSGLTRLNQDTLKIPLRWYIFHSNSEARQQADAPEPRQGFALVAASQLDPSLLGNPEITRLLKQNEHPYATFTRTPPSYTASEILCNVNGPDSVRQTSWADCNDIPRRTLDLKDKLVVVGEHSSGDLQPFPGGERYGVELQTAYISSLLTGHFLHPFPHNLDMLLVAFVFTTIFLTEWLLRDQPYGDWIGLSLYLLALLLTLLVSFILFSINSWYPRIFVFSLFTFAGLLLLKLSSALFFTVRELAHKEH